MIIMIIDNDNNNNNNDDDTVYLANLFTIISVGETFIWASSTMAEIFEIVDDVDDDVVSSSRQPCWITVPLYTCDRRVFSSGAASPEIELSSTEALPLTTIPSRGMSSPCRTAIMAPRTKKVPELLQYPWSQLDGVLAVEFEFTVS